MDNENLKDYLKEMYPRIFEGWDGFELSVSSRIRGGDMETGTILVTLHNRGKDGNAVDLHACFLMTLDDNGDEVIRDGKHELATEYNSAYIPEWAK